MTMLARRRLFLLVFAITAFLIGRGCRHYNETLTPGTGKLKIGVWILNLQRYCNDNNGTVGVAKLLANHGIAYAVPKTHSTYYRGHLTSGWYPTCSKQLFREFVTACHSKGVKVYSWVYVYGGTAASTDIEKSSQALSSDADGLVLNAESEYCRDTSRYNDAEQLCSSIRTLRDNSYPGKLLAYSTFARSWKGIGLRFPYRVFGQYCDQFWPQTYWRTFGWTPEDAIDAVDSHFQTKYAKWQANPIQAVSVKPIIHTGHAYAKTIPADEVQRFLEHASRQGHGEVNLYIADLFSDEQWLTINSFTVHSSKIAQTITPFSITGIVASIAVWIWGVICWIAHKLLWVYVIVALARGTWYFLSSSRRGFNRINRTMRLALLWPMDFYQGWYL